MPDVIAMRRKRVSYIQPRLICGFFWCGLKAFYGLLEYAISRKRKEVRIARALDERRNRLLRTGVTQWMKV